MMLVTGGAGFIGSNLVAALSGRHEIAVCDWMGQDERWRNLAKHEICDLIPPEDLTGWLSRSRKITAVFHMGANSSTTERDVEQLAEYNIRFTLALWRWCCETGTRFIYASSAATYGDGSAGFDDNDSPETLARLRPLNAYGWSKHLFDRHVARQTREQKKLPPQWVGLKFFNVYGPNEYHKGTMKSLVARNFPRVANGEAIQLFKSANPNYADGGQIRDFVYVQDCVDVMLWLIDRPQVSGLFNLGTGQGRTWLDLAKALFLAANRELQVEFIDMPEEVARKYQYYTQANMTKLRAAGYTAPFRTLEDGVSDYVRNFLAAADPYR